MISKLISVLAITAAILIVTDGQNVANQCLAEQTRNNGANNQRRPVTAEEITMASFDAICNSYTDYIDCFDTRLPNSRQVADRFLTLMFERDNMVVAYQGLCTLDLERLRPNIRCLLSTPEVRRCYNAFNIGVNQVITLQNQQRLPLVTLQELACNVSVARYTCETAVYEFCNRDAGEIMQNFFFALIPQQCRDNTGVTSRYTAIFNSAPVPPGNVLLTTAMVLMIFILCF